MSNHETFHTTDAPTLFIDAVGGDLRMSGRAEPGIALVSEESRTTYGYQRQEQEDSANGETIHLGSFGGDCRLEIPRNATIHIGPVGGDAAIHSVGGEIALSTIGGDLHLRDAGSVKLDSLGGDLRVKKLGGDLHAGRIGGDVGLLDVAGSVYVEQLGGDLSLSNIRGPAIRATAGGDATLRLSLGPDHAVQVEAGGDLACFLPPETSAVVNLRSGTRTVKLHGWNAPPPESDEVYSFTLGDGEAALNLSARGDIALMAQQPAAQDQEPFSAEFRARWEQDLDWENFEPHVAFAFDSNVGQQFGNLSEEMALRIQEKVQRAMQRAEQKIAEAMRHAEEKIARAEEKAARMDERQRRRQERTRRRTWTPPTPPTPAVPPRAARPKEKTVSDAERMTVLRMVEEGKISVEQAEQLLDALRK